MFLMGMNIWVLRVTGRADVLGLLVSVGSLALFLFNPIGGYISDRFDRRKLYVWSDLVSAAALLTLLLTYEFSKSLNLPLLFLTSVIISAAFAVYSPTTRALAPFLVERVNLSRLNSALSMSNEVIRFTAPIVSALIWNYSPDGVRTVLLFNIISFLFSAVCGVFLRVREYDLATSENSFLKEYLKLWREMGSIKGIIVATMFVNFFAGGLNVLIPLEAAGRHGENVKGYSVVMIGQALGAFLGGSLALQIKKSLDTKALTFLIGAISVSLLPYIFFQNLVALTACLSLYGFLTSIFAIHSITSLQSKVPSTQMGKAFGLYYAVSTGLTPIGSMLFGKLFALISRSSFMVAVAGLALTGLFIFITNNDSSKSSENMKVEEYL